MTTTHPKVVDATPRIVTVLVNWRGADDTMECLESLLQSDYSNQRVVVVDNGSRDGSLEKLRAWASGDVRARRQGPLGEFLLSNDASKPVKANFVELSGSTCADVWADETWLVVIDAGRNHGFAGGVNIGIRCAMSDFDVSFVWVLNNDTIVAPDCLFRMQSRMRADNSVGMCGSRQLFYSQPTVTQVVGGASMSRLLGRSKLIGAGLGAHEILDTVLVERQMDHLSGASMLVSRAFIQRIGLMEEGYFLYYEEADWAARGREHFRFACAGDAIVYHKEGASIGSSHERKKRSPMAAFFMVRSRLLFTRRYNWWALPLVFTYSALIAVRAWYEGQNEQARAMLAALIGRSAKDALGWIPD